MYDFFGPKQIKDVLKSESSSGCPDGESGFHGEIKHPQRVQINQHQVRQFRTVSKD